MTEKAIKVRILGSLAAVALRVGMNVSRDARHYNRIRAMSGQGAIWQDVQRMIREIIRRERESPIDLPSVIAGLPAVIARYVKIKAMSSPLYVPSTR